MLLAVPALALVCAPALARPGYDSLPPNSMKPDVQVHMSTFSDGRGDRGDTKAFGTDRFGRDSYDRQPSRTTPDRPTDTAYGRPSHESVPLKAEVQQKLQSGDSREGSTAAKPAARTAPEQRQASDLMGRQAKPAPIPLQPQVMLRLQNGDSRDSGGAKPNAAARPADRQAEHKQSLSRSQKEALCKQTGVCMPLATGSDDVEDKTE
jgi:hypothetical protein